MDRPTPIRGYPKTADLTILKEVVVWIGSCRKGDPLLLPGVCQLFQQASDFRDLLPKLRKARFPAQARAAVMSAETYALPDF